MPRLISSPLLLVLALVTLLSVLSSVSAQDPQCSTGIIRNAACCKAECGQCGGAGCYRRSLAIGTRCCDSGIVNPKHNVPSCTVSGPPCILSEPLPSPSPSPSPQPDPLCATGVRGGNKACCRAVCGKCGGMGCGERSRMHGTRCCIGGIIKPENNLPLCENALPPCLLQPVSTPPTVTPSPSTSAPPSPSPSTSPVSKPFSSNKGMWKTANVAGSTSVVARHEACAVMVDGKVVLIGGRGAKPVSVYDPKTGVWTTKSRFNRWLQIHHFQCVAARGSVWIPSSWKATFPFEENNEVVFEYVVATDTWKTHPGLSVDRSRGGAAAVVIDNLIYVIAGNRGGHGEHAQSLTWVDAFNLDTKEWTIDALAEMPDAGRDHVGAAVLGNGDICVTGGRDGGSKGFFRNNIASTYCYSFSEEKWVKKADLPAPRAGAMTGTTCDGRLMIAGGEGNGQAYARVDVFDGVSWTRAPDMVQARHGSGLAVTDCSCGHIFIPSGSGRQGGSPELETTEQWIPEGAPMECEKY